jgi:serine/threonine protein kinase
MADDVFGIVGTTLAAAFNVEAVVAEGGFAVVYRAYHAGFRAPVALKCLKIPQHLSRADQERFEEQFQAEAELLFKLSASIPTVVRPLHVEAIIAPDGSFMPFLALEWLEGETLDAVAQRRARAGMPPFSLEQLISMLTPVARALERAHRFEGPEGPISIVHRDMKPENVFVARIGGESVVKILDFGIGKAKSVASQVAGRASQNDVGVTSFTPAYGAPEQWAPRRYGQTGPWTDVWGLALTLVELLAARPIIDGDQSAMMGTALDPVRRPTPRTEGVTISDASEAVFARALALDPRDRYVNAGEFWDALVAAQQPDMNRQPRLSAQGGVRGSSGRSGAYSFRGTPSQSAELGRNNLIPDLDVPLGSSAALEFERAPAQKATPSRSGEWRAPVPATVDDSTDLASDPEGSVGLELELEEKPGPSHSGQWRAPIISTVDEGPGPQNARGSLPPGPAQSGQWPAAPRAESVRPSTPRPSAPPSTGVAKGRSDRPSERAAGSVPAPLIASSVPPILMSQRPSLTGAARSTPARPPPPVSASSEMVRRFRAPAIMMVVGILTTIGDGAYASARGEVFTLGPIHLAWLAAALVIGGIVLAAYRLLFDVD